MTLLLLITGMALGVFLYHYAGPEPTIRLAAVLLTGVFVWEAMNRWSRGEQR
jgi:hypothetical protein